MAGAKFQYDESGGTFFYFLLSFEALVVIPCTYYFWPRDSLKQELKRDKTICHCDHCRVKNSRLRSKEPWRKAKQRFIKFLLLIGWTAMFLTAYKVAHLQHDYIAYDPFEILQIDPAASMSEIKKAYRRLSLVFHPDKESGDEKKFMMIAKAYAALTDDEARKNWEMYGNPDGPGATSFGIALPSWIVEKENSVWVLGLYALVFMVALPVAVGIWWYRSVKYGGDEVLLDTSQLYYFFLSKTPYMILKRVIMVLAASFEFEKGHNSEIIERPSDNIEVPQLIKDLPNLGERNREKFLCYTYSIKARALVFAHLSRMKLSATLEEDKLYVVKKCPYLLQDFIQCAAQITMLALAGKVPRTPNLDTIENAMKLCPLIVQALWDNRSPLLQLPHVTGDMLRHFQTRKRNIRSIRNLACMKSDDRRAMLRSLNDDQYDDVMNVISKMPLIDVEVKSEVLDDEDSCTITAGAIVTVTAKLTRKHMNTLFGQDVSTETGNFEETEECEQNGALVNGDISPKTKKSKVWEKQKKRKGGRGNKSKKKGSAAAASNKAVNAPSESSKSAPVEQRNGAPANMKVKREEKSKESKGDAAESSGESDTETGSSHSVSASAEQDSKQNNEVDDAEWEQFQQKVVKKENSLETKSKISHRVHSPLFPEDKQEYWWIYLADKKQKHALLSIPYLMTNLVEEEEVELKFTAPTKPGLYTYSLIVRSDSYIDFDVMKTIKVDVKEAKEIDLTKLQWDVSEEEEDKDEEESAVEDSDLATGDELDDDDDE